MKKKYVVSAITLALLGIQGDQNGSTRMVVNAATTQTQAKVEAKATTTAKAEAKAESKSTAKTSVSAEVEDFFSQPFQQVLAQSSSYEDAMQDTSFDKMPTEGIDLGGLKGKVEEVAKPVTDNIDDKDKQAMKEQAKDLGGDMVKKPLEVMNTAGKIVNSPEAHIVAKAAGGQEGEAKLKQTQDVVNKANDIVGNAKARFQMMALDQFPNFDQINQMSIDPSQGQPNSQQESAFDMPIVSQIQALDQYGNVIASAQNPKMEQYLKRQRNQQAGFAQNTHQQQPLTQQQPQQQQQQVARPQPQQQQPPQFTQMTQNFMGFQQPNMMAINNNGQVTQPQQQVLQPQQQQPAPQQIQHKQQINSQAPQFANNGQQQNVQQQMQQKQMQQNNRQTAFQQQQPPIKQQQSVPRPPQQTNQNIQPQEFELNGGLSQQQPNPSEQKQEKKEEVAVAHDKQQMNQCKPNQQGKKQDQQGQSSQGPSQDFTPFSQSPFQPPFMNEQQQMFYQQQMGGFGHMQPPQMPMMNGPGGLFMPPQMSQQFSGPMPQNPYLFQMPPNMMPFAAGGMNGNGYGQQFSQQQQQLAALQAQQQQQHTAPFDAQLVQNNQDVHTGAVPQEILDLESGHQKAGSRNRRGQQQHAHGLTQPPHQSSGKQSRPHDVTNLQTKDFFMPGPYGYSMWQPSMFPQMYSSYYYPQQQMPAQFGQLSPQFLPNYYFGQMGAGSPGGMTPQQFRPFQPQNGPMTLPQGFNTNNLATQNMFRNMPNQQQMIAMQKQQFGGAPSSTTQWGNMQMSTVPQGAASIPTNQKQQKNDKQINQTAAEKDEKLGQQAQQIKK